MPIARKSYKIRCYPNSAQIRILSGWFGASRWLWNWALSSRTKAYKRRKDRLNSIDISRRLTKLKKLPNFSWLQSPPATCLTQTLRDQDQAFYNFYRRVKSGDNPEYPKYRSRHDNHASLRFQAVSLSKWNKGIVSLPKLGKLKLAESLSGIVCPEMVTLKKEPDGNYYICFGIPLNIELMPSTDGIIGIDLGLTHLAILSNGEKIDNPRKLLKRRKYLKQQQRCLARRVRGSERYKKQRLRVARVHSKVKNQRNNHAHNLTTRLVKENQIICIEDLKINNIMKNPRLAGHVLDAGWGEIRRQLEYKCQWYGRTLVVVDQWFPSSKTCSGCGHKMDEMRLDIRQWICPKCQTEHDRDINAAQNIAVAGMLQLAGREDRYLPVEAAFVDAANEAGTWLGRSSDLTKQRTQAPYSGKQSQPPVD